MQYTGLPSVGLKGTCVSFLQSAHVVGNISLSIDDMVSSVSCWVLTVHMEIGTVYSTDSRSWHLLGKYFQNRKHGDNTVKFDVKNMNEIKWKSEDLIEKEQFQKGSKISCIKEENYLTELMLNSKSMQRMQDFISNLE